MENEKSKKLHTLLDAREAKLNKRILDTLNRIEGKMDRLTLKVSAHDALLKKAK